MRSHVILPVFLVCFFGACTQPREAHRMQEVEGLRGKTSADVIRLLGTPRVVDSSASPTERIWGYYHVPLRSDDRAQPRQRTVLIVFSKRDSLLVVDDVRIP